jgi:hypothetical protein
VVLFCLPVAVLLGASTTANAQLPADFPAITTRIYDTNALGTGYVFLASMPLSKDNRGLPHYLLILNNDGTPHAYKKVWYQVPGDFYENDFKVLPNGLLHYSQFFGFYSYTDGGIVEHVILDENLNEIGPRIQMGNGYVSDSHDFELTPNGHSVLVGYYTTLTDLSQVVPGGYPRAEISGAIVQELDANRNVIWQWRTWDHFTLQDYPYWAAGSTAPASAGWHVNVARQDPKDGNMLVATTEEVMKINRQTGEVMWRLGGGANQFTFVGVDEQEGNLQLGGHDFNRLANGNVMIYDGGTADETRTSQVHEYQLDEQNKIARQVWSYVATETTPNWSRGSAQRLPNGNTFIGWGTCSDTNINPPDCTEVTSAGSKVWEMWFNDRLLNSYRAFRNVYPPSAQRIQKQHFELASGNTYNFTNTGVVLEVTSRTGDGYNSVIVAREPYAPLFPIFQGKAPRLLPVRVNLSQTAIDSITGIISFDMNSFGMTDPTNTTVYYRAAQGEVFVPLPTQYNWVTHQVNALMDGFGDFALGFPDLADVAFPPLLIEPESLQSTGFVTRVPPVVQAGKSYSVNQQLPIALSWTPKGFATSYALQISTNASFATPEVDRPFQLEARYTFTNARPNTTYFWRVNTSNDAGGSDWATNAFSTVPPQVQVTAPNGSEAWQRGRKYFIQWNDNLLENVAIELYKGGVFVKNITTNAPSTVSYKWTIDLSLAPASDYSIKIRSSTNATVFDTGDATFSIIDAPSINANSVTRLPDGRVQFGLTAPGAAQVTVLGSTNLTDWQALQPVSVTNGSAVFTEDTATNYPARFYRLRVP